MAMRIPLLHCHVTGQTCFLTIPYYHPSPTIASHSFVLLFVLRLPTNSVRCLWVFESSALNTPPTVYTLSTIVQWNDSTVYELYHCVHSVHNSSVKWLYSLWVILLCTLWPQLFRPMFRKTWTLRNFFFAILKNHILPIIDIFNTHGLYSCQSQLLSPSAYRAGETGQGRRILWSTTPRHEYHRVQKKI